MKTMTVKTLTFTKKNAPEVISIANKLATAEGRKPTDVIRRLIREEGIKKLSNLTEANSTT